MFNKLKNFFKKKEAVVEEQVIVPEPTPIVEEVKVEEVKVETPKPAKKKNKKIKADFDKCTVAELKVYAEELGLKNYQRYKKTDLIAKIKELNE